MNPLLFIAISEWDGGWIEDNKYKRYKKFAWTKDLKTWSLKKVFKYYVEKSHWPDGGVRANHPTIETYEIRKSEYKRSTSQKVFEMYQRLGKIIKVQ